MFSKTFISSVSRLLLCNFLYLNLHLKKSADKDSKPLQLANFCEEKMILDLKKGWKAEVS